MTSPSITKLGDISALFTWTVSVEYYLRAGHTQSTIRGHVYHESVCVCVCVCTCCMAEWGWEPICGFLTPAAYLYWGTPRTGGAVGAAALAGRGPRPWEAAGGEGRAHFSKQYSGLLSKVWCTPDPYIRHVSYKSECIRIFHSKPYKIMTIVVILLLLYYLFSNGGEKCHVCVFHFESG